MHSDTMPVSNETSITFKSQIIQQYLPFGSQKRIP